MSTDPTRSALRACDAARLSAAVRWVGPLLDVLQVARRSVGGGARRVSWHRAVTQGGV